MCNVNLGYEKFNLFGEQSLDDLRQDSLDIVQIIPFESSRKWSGIVMKIENGYRLYQKGAAEIIFKACGYKFIE